MPLCCFQQRVRPTARSSVTGVEVHPQKGESIRVQSSLPQSLDPLRRLPERDACIVKAADGEKVWVVAWADVLVWGVGADRAVVAFLGWVAEFGILEGRELEGIKR